MIEESKVNLKNIAQGAVDERFSAALSQVIENIFDFNTEPKTVREITINVKIAPSESREMASVKVEVKNKLAAHKAIGTAFYLGSANGEFVAVENNPRQLGFDSLTTPDEGTKKDVN